MVTQSNCESANGSFSALASTQRDVADEAGVQQAVAAFAEHRGVDVREDDHAGLADLLREAGSQVAGAAGDVERALAGCRPVSDSVNSFQSRCAPPDMRSFIRS